MLYQIKFFIIIPFMARKTSTNKSRTKSKSKSRNRKSNKKINFKGVIIALSVIMLLAFLGFAGYKVYKKYVQKNTVQNEISVVGGADEPTGVCVSEKNTDETKVETSNNIKDSIEKENLPVETALDSQTDKKAETDGGENRPAKNQEGFGEENSSLFFGNPSDAVKDIALETNYLIEKENYTMSYNNETLCPNWVSWHLDNDDMGDAPRSNKFAPDKELPEEWHAVTKSDYQYNAYGFDRGHVCPSADRTYSKEANKETFLMTNMVPQSPENNRVVWVALEKYQREIVDAGKEVYIFAGPAGTGGIGDRGYFDYILLNGAGPDCSDLKINVPAYTWKILLVIPQGENDWERIDENTQVISVCIPNKKGINSDLSWKKYLCSVDDIERLTGYDFFELLDDSIEEKLESSVADADSL